MAYPFLLGIPIPGLKRPESLTLISPGDQQPPPHDTTEAQAIIADVYENPQTHDSPLLQEEELEDLAVPLKKSLGDPQTPPGEQLSPPASPVVIDLTGLDSEDESDSGDESDTSPSPSPLNLPQAFEEESGSTSEPGSPSGSNDSPETSSSTPPSSPPEPALPGTGRVPSLAQAIEPDHKHLEPGDLSQPPGQDAPSGTKRPADPEPDNQGTKVDKPPSRKRGRPRKEPPPPTYKATVAELPTDVRSIPGALGIDDQIIERVKKCFNRAENASGTTEAEARAALHLAFKLMSQHNVKHAEVLSCKTPEEQAQTAGRSIVKIQRTDEKHVKVPIRVWVMDLAQAMSVFFDCEQFCEQPLFRVDWIFYGIAQNTASAAVAFERIYNLIMDWTQCKKGVSTTNSYCLGVANGLRRDARREKDEELKRAKQAEVQALAKKEREEEFQRQEEIRRLQQPTIEDESDSEIHPQRTPLMSPEASGSTRCHTHIVDLGDTPSDTSSDTASESGDAEMADVNKPMIISDYDEDDGKECEADFNIDDDISHLTATTYKESPSPCPPPRTASHPLQLPTPSTPPREQTPEREPQWKSAMQLTRFRQTATNVAENYLKSKGIKLSKGRKITTYPKDLRAFREGWNDSRKIDVHQKAQEKKRDGDDRENDDEIT